MDGQRITRNKWARYIASFKPDTGKKVQSMSVNLQANDFTGSINITDLQVQSGNQVTVQMPNSSEFLKELTYNFDEAINMEGVTDDSGRPAIKKGVQPIDYQNMKTRVYNIVGRGHEVLAFPNVFHEDYTKELLTSGLDLELYAKEDFDWLRISTNDGALIPYRYYQAPVPADHPLNYKYSREFYLNKGSAGDKIVLSCTLLSASVGSQTFGVGDKVATFDDARQRLMMAPYGSFRLRIEFYKRVDEYLGATDDNGNPITTNYVKDAGIGFYGTATFKQIQAAHLF